MAGRPDFQITMGLVGASNIITGIQSAIAILGRLIAKGQEWAKEAQAYQRVVEGHTVSVQRADIATQGLVDTLELHRQAARLEAAGIAITAEQYQAITVAATNFARRTGGEVTPAVEQLTSAVISASSRGLRPYGIDLATTGTLAQRQRRVIDQLTSSFGDQQLEIENTSEAIYALQNNWGTAWSEMLLAVENSAGPMRTIIQDLNSLLSDFNNAMETARRAREHMSRMGNTQRLLDIQNEVESMGYTMSGRPGAGVINAAQRAWYTPEGDTGALEATVRGLIAEYVRLDAADNRALRDGTQQVVSDAPERGAAGGDEPGGGGGSGRPTRDTSARDIEQADTSEFMFEAREAVYAAREELEQQHIDKRRGMVEAARELADSQAQGEIDANERRLENMRAFNDAAVALWQKESEDRERSLDNLKTYAQTAYQIYGQMVTAVGGLAGALAENAEEQKKIEGGIRVAQQVGALLYATTMAAIEYAGQNYVQAAMYTAAIVVAGVDLAKTIAEFGVQSKSGVSGSGSSTGARGAAAASGSMYQGRQGAVTVYFTGPVTSRRARDEVVALERDGARGY